MEHKCINPSFYNATEIRKAEIYFGILTHEYNHIYTSQCNINVSTLRFIMRQKSEKQKSTSEFSLMNTIIYTHLNVT